MWKYFITILTLSVKWASNVSTLPPVAIVMSEEGTIWRRQACLCFINLQFYLAEKPKGSKQSGSEAPPAPAGGAGGWGEPGGGWTGPRLFF